MKKVIIVGGGTAGWMTAAYLAKLNSRGKPEKIDITLIESKQIGIIGVGEATIPTIREFLSVLEIPEKEFMRATNATFKQAIRFDGWIKNPGIMENDKYYHPFENPLPAGALDSAPFWLRARESGNMKDDFAYACSLQPALCDQGKAPRRQDHPDYNSPLRYAYHMDAALFGEYLCDYSKKLGVRRIIDTVTEVTRKESGDISTIITQEHGAISGDLFIDCTGFAGLLIEKSLNVPFKDVTHQLFCDKAVTLRLANDMNKGEFNSFTKATAQEAGWIWDIPLRDRRGMGHVFSSAFTTKDLAEQRLRDYAGPMGKDAEVRHIDMRIGRRETSWKHNVVAIGLSAGFLEPLESTGLYLIEMGIRFLCDHFPISGCSPSLANEYNRVMGGLFDHITDFVKLHYCLSQRNDTEFWRANRDLDSIPSSL